MAAAGGHWTKAAVGPLAGQAVFVPKTEPIQGIGGYAGQNGMKQGNLYILQHGNGQWEVLSQAKNGDWHTHGIYASKQLAKGKMNNLAEQGGSKIAVIGGPMPKVPAIAKKPAVDGAPAPAPKPKAGKQAPVVGEPAPKPAVAKAAIADAYPHTAQSKAAEQAILAAKGNQYYLDAQETFGTQDWTGTKADALYSDYFGPHMNSLTPGQFGSVRKYQNGSYDTINTKLWADEPGYTKSASVKNIDAAIASSPGLPRRMRLYRGTENKAMIAYAMKAKPGDVWTPKGYSSTTIKSTSSWHTGRTVRMTFLAPKGTPGIYMNAGKNSEHPGEYEYLLPRGMSWRVKSANQSGGIYYLVMEAMNG